ncbi:MAG: hypothetical protein GC151_20135 [Betaproteobacteria bacterium]|nr:hypothetical protein [Betaproteobacteria bacterium]
MSKPNPYPPRPAAALMALAVGVLPCLAHGATDFETESRMKALETLVQELRQEVHDLRSRLGETGPAKGEAASSAGQGTAEAVAPAKAVAPAPVAAPTAAQADKAVRDVQFEVRQTDRKVSALESKVTNEMPTARLANGLIIDDPLGRWSLRATARMEFDYRDYGNNGVNADTFSVRRARTGLGLTLGKMFTVYVEAEHSSGSGTQAGTSAKGGLHQAYIDFTPAASAKLRVGQFKPQFGLENTMSTWQHDFQERSLASNLVSSTQNNVLFDRGVMLYGAPKKGIDYGISITNGTGTGLDEYQRASAEASSHSKDLTARLTANIAELAGLSDWVLHVGASYKSGDQANYCPPTGTISATNPCGFRASSATTESRSLTFFNPRPFNAQGSTTAASSVQRQIRGLEAAIAWRNVKFQAEGLEASYAGELIGGGGFDRKIEAGYFALNWLATGEMFADAYKSGHFGRIRPNDEFGTGPGTGWGALEAGLRFSYWDAHEFQPGPATDVTGVDGTNSASPAVTQSANKANAWTVALKWMPTAYTAYMVNVVRTNFGNPVIANGRTLENENAVLMRAQFDFF